MAHSVNKLLGYANSKKHEPIQYLPENQQNNQHIKLIACRKHTVIFDDKYEKDKLHL